MFKAVRFMLFLCFLAVIWALAHSEFGFYFDRAHSRGGRVYRVNSYEQFMKRKAGDAPMVSVA